MLGYKGTDFRVTEGKRPADFLKILFEVWIGFLDYLELPLAYNRMSKVRGEVKPGPSARRGAGPLLFQWLFRSCQLSKVLQFPPPTFCFKKVYRRVGRMCSEKLYTQHLDSVVQILLFLLR